MSEFVEMRRVVAARPCGPDIVALDVERHDLRFEPGDCMALYADEGRVSRPYSLASGTADPVLRFIVRRMDGGDVSPYLCSRKAGDEVRVSPPFGWFRPGANAALRPYVFLATGPGIAPFFAYLRSPGAVRPAASRYGVRAARDLVEPDWLREHAGARFAVSREVAPDCWHGRLTDHLRELPEGDHDFYLCGLDSMIDEVTHFLQARGVPLPRIHRECFFNAPVEG